MLVQVVKNIASVVEDGAPRKRIRAHLRESELRKLAADKSSKLERLLAIASYKAEEIRAEGGSLDEQEALARFELNPFRWDTEGWQSQVDICFLWTWQGTDGTRQKAFVYPRLDNVFKRQVPRPPMLDEADVDILRGLQEAACLETKQSKAPCEYLGVHLGKGKYEPDPTKWPCRSYPGAKTHAMVYYEWVHVLCEGSPYRCSIRVNDLRHNQRAVPGNPLKPSACSNLTFSIEFMQAVAANVHPSLKFKGIAYEQQERPAILEQLPHEGVDIQDDALYWTMPDGQCECWSVREVAHKRPDELIHAAEGMLEAAYTLVAQEFGYHVLGKGSDEHVDALRAEPGTLADRNWEKYTWVRPADESATCWWVANAAEANKKETTKLKCRSLTSLRLELQASRLATSGKLRKEWDRRLHDNAAAVDRLRNNLNLWKHVSGPDPERLLKPSEADLLAAQQGAAALRRMVDKREPGQEQAHVEAFAEELIEATQMLSVVGWEAIRRERFSLTPTGLYDDLVRTAASLLSRADAESTRRQEFLASDAKEEEAQTLPPSSPLQSEEGGPDLEVFKGKTGKPSPNWHKAVKQATAIIVDDMRTLLECHYDDVHLQRWRQKHADAQKRAPERRGKHKVFASVAQSHRRRLHEALELPATVKSILRCPEDETSWSKMEALRRAICRVVEGEKEVFVESAAELETIAVAIEANGSSKLHDDVGEGCKLRAGVRVLLDTPSRSKRPKPCRTRVAKFVRDLKDNDSLRVLMRPLNTCRAPSLDSFGQEMFSDKSMKEVASGLSLSIEQVLDRMLPVLHDALLLAQSEDWTKSLVGNLAADETYELARWFELGQNVGKQPLFDGICSMCGALLYGVLNRTSAISNKCSAPPCDRDGKPLTNPDCSPCTNAQPPFLLRYSPQLFAKEGQEMFYHDPETNCLSLKPSVLVEPWIRQAHATILTDDPNVWLYCPDCREKWFRRSGERGQSHIPFRDKASQHWLKPTYRRGKEKGEEDIPEKEPEGEPSQVPSPHETEDEEDAVEWVPELPAEVAQRPSLEEYQRRWDAQKAWHARCVPGEFSRDNLVPVPEPQLWQDCPYVLELSRPGPLGWL